MVIEISRREAIDHIRKINERIESRNYRALQHLMPIFTDCHFEFMKVIDDAAEEGCDHSEYLDNWTNEALTQHINNGLYHHGLREDGVYVTGD